MTGIKTPYLSVIIKFISTNFFCQYQQIYYLSYFHTGLYEKQTGAFCPVLSFCLIIFVDTNRRRLGITHLSVFHKGRYEKQTSQKYDFRLPLRSPFTIFVF